MNSSPQPDSSQSDLIKIEYQNGRAAFERGDYRQSVQFLEKAAALASRQSRLSGEVQLWLVTAYEANGQREEAISLCRQLTRFPDPETRKQSRRVLFIMEAPKLHKRSEWLTQIPDLTKIEEGNGTSLYSSAEIRPQRRSTKTPTTAPDPVDLSQINTRDNRFIWLALGVIGLMLIGLVWLS